MGSNSTQGLAVLVFLATFASLGGAFAGGSVLWLAVFAIGAIVSIALFVKAKSCEHTK